MSEKETALELSTTITAFLDGSAGDYDWDDLMCGRGLEDIRNFCSDVQVLFPSGEDYRYTNTEGVAVLANLAELLKVSPDAAQRYVADVLATFPDDQKRL